MKKIFITGGHFAPAEAVIQELLRRGGWEIYYIGRKHSIEGDQALALEYIEIQKLPTIKYLPITAGRIQRKFFINIGQSIAAFLKIFIGFWQSVIFIGKYRPDIVLSFGGYVAVPVATMAWLFGVPVIHHEQVLVLDYPGKYLSSIAIKVLVSHKELLPQNPNSKWFLVGNTLRPEIFESHFTSELSKLRDLKTKLKLPIIYITGGNLGSHAINTVVLGNLKDILDQTLVIWQTGDSQEFQDFDKIIKKINKLPSVYKERVLVKKFISGLEIGVTYELSDLVVGRSGANTIFELTALKKPAILILISWFLDIEPLFNASTLERLGLA